MFIEFVMIIIYSFVWVFHNIPAKIKYKVGDIPIFINWRYLEHWYEEVFEFTAITIGVFVQFIVVLVKYNDVS